MPLFQCQKCGCVENTAVGAYWGNEEHLCSECAYGKWHNIFPKRSAVGMFIDQDGHLWSKQQADGGTFPSHYTIVGIIE